MSVLVNNNGSLVQQDASAVSQLAAVDTENILGGGAGATTDGQTLIDRLAEDDVQAQSDISTLQTDKAEASTIAVIESASTSSAAYSAGDYIYHANALYRVTAPISIGDTFIVGTNIETATVCDEISDIKTDLSDKLNMADYAKTGSINVLNNAAATATSNNVVFTVNADKTITVYTNGAASADANCEIITSNVPVDDDLYLTGCPSGGSSTTYGIQFYSTNVPNGGWDVGSGRKISATDTITRIVIRIRSGQNIPSSSPLVFKIMLSPIKDAPYVPYAMTNRELTKSVSGSAEDVSFTTTTQTKYEYRSISSIKRRGNFVQCCIRMQSLTGNELPSGKTYTYVLTGLPRIATDLEATVPSGTSLSNNPMQIVYFANGTLGVRGGSPNDYYNASFLGLIV